MKIVTINRKKQTTYVSSKKGFDLKVGDKIQIEKTRDFIKYTVIETIERISDKSVLINGQIQKRVDTDIATIV